MLKIMTPGPTQVSERVRMARSLECTNPDLDPAFFDFYKETCQCISSLLHTKNETLILDGEGILGLEACCASLTEPGDPVLVIDNGVYGKGFADFVQMYGGNPTLYTTDYLNPVNPDKLDEFLCENHHFKYATLVHCDTPSGMLNDVSVLCPILKKYGILTVVDSVSGMFGNELSVDDCQIDLLCGGSQKALSAPPGLTFVVISDEAKEAIHKRKTPVASFYANLAVFDGYYESKWFPYTMPISDIYGLRAALEELKEDTDRIPRHHRIASAVRTALVNAGLSLHLESGFSDTVTVFDIPEGITADDILMTMKEDCNILLAGSFDSLSGKVIRIGHMGTNANIADVEAVLKGLDYTFEKLGISLKASLLESFQAQVKTE
ncbi:MAG: alanine--glyoxylate aminotransferase family protein [Clostridiales bacterium]|nr:alanine--glyoxylate aminotransferase family protein [Clostridiales bacterium]